MKSLPRLTVPEIRTPRLILRPLVAEDAEPLYEVIDTNRDEFSRWFTWSRQSTMQATRQNIREGIAATDSGSELHYTLCLRDGTVIGRIGLSQIDHRAHSAELGYWLTRDVAGQGLMSEAVRGLLALMLSQTQTLRVDAYADTENAASRRVLTKVGFRWTGTVKRAVHHPERGWRDHEHYVLISTGH